MTCFIDVAHAKNPRSRAYRLALLLGAVAVGACGGADTGQSTDGGSHGGVVCTSFTYSAWGTCQSGTQTRTVTTSSPKGCGGGNPVLSQGCGSTNNGSTLYQTCGSATCHGPLATSDLKGKGVTVQLVQTTHAGAFGLTSAELQAIVTAIGP
jgi:hypothetical protein